MLLAQALGSYRQRPVHSALKPYASSIWAHTVSAEFPQRVSYAPDGFPELFWINGTPWIYGPATGPTFEELPGSCAIVGLALQPGVIPTWTGAALSEVIGTRVPLRELLPKQAERLMNIIGDASSPTEIGDKLEAAVTNDLLRSDPPDESHAYIREAFDRRDATFRTTSQIADDLGSSERTLRRRCESLFGYGPKTLERVLRIQRFLSLARGPVDMPLVTIAYDAGFSDQAHLTREARLITGLTPSEILRQLAIISRSPSAMRTTE